jgi:hypothetical protein
MRFVEGGEGNTNTDVRHTNLISPVFSPCRVPCLKYTQHISKLSNTHRTDTMEAN